MATITNRIIPEVYAPIVTSVIHDINPLLKSGAIQRSAKIDEYAAGIGAEIKMPIFLDQGYQAATVSTADTSVLISARSPKTALINAHIDDVNYAWSETQLAQVVTGDNALDHVTRNVVGRDWSDELSTRIYAKIAGVFKDNATNDSSDMIHNVATDATAAVADIEKYNFSTHMDAIAGLPASMLEGATLVMHSHVFYDLMKSEPHSAIRPSAVNPFASYAGMNVIIDNRVPVASGTNRATYTTYILGAGSILYGEGASDVAVETSRAVGGGRGATTLFSNRRFIIQPAGFDSKAIVATNAACPVVAEYDKATAWDRKVNRDQVGIIAVKTNVRKNG